MLGIRTSSFPTNFWTPRREFVEYKEATPQPEPNAYDNDPIMEEKRQIVEDRKALKEKTIQQKERAIPGAKLLKKLDKQRRLENSLVRVVKDLSI